jgi:hypothetical protein
MNLYLSIVLVTIPIALPVGLRIIADLLHKQEGFVITLGMRIGFIVVMTLCAIAFVPACVYVGNNWDEALFDLYVVFGFLILYGAIAGDYEGEKSEDRSGDPT